MSSDRAAVFFESCSEKAACLSSVSLAATRARDLVDDFAPLKGWLCQAHDTNSCLALYCMDTGHTFNWQDTRILGSANSQKAREAIEALHSGEHSVNQFMQLDPCFR